MKQSRGRWTCGMAVGALALSIIPVYAQTDTMGTTGTMGADTTMMSSQPTLVTGRVVRYYVDRSGYVTAMDIETASGVQMVRFQPDIGQRLYTTYPVGGTASVYAVGSPYMGTTRWDVVSLGTMAPTSATMLMPYMASDIDLLEGEPYILGGQEEVMIRGKLRNLIVKNNGEVLGLVLDGVKMGDLRTGPDNGMETTGQVLVRVPRELRHVAPGYTGTDRVTPLFRGAEVEVVGFAEAPRFGALSSYSNRLAARTIVVNRRDVGALGFPMMEPRRNSLFNWDIGGTTMTTEEANASQWGYTTYSPMGTMTTGTTTTSGTTGQ